MHLLRAMDIGLFRWINSGMANSFFDVIMPFFSGNRLFAPALIFACIALVWKAGARGRVCVLMLILAIALGDTFVCNTIKHAVQRPRPFHGLENVHIPSGAGTSDSGSMPSSHAANWFAATVVIFIYYRRSVWIVLTGAVLVGFSRIYNGVHYPSDVLAGAILGAGYAAGGVWSLDALWRWAGPKWFPLWWKRFPSLMNPVFRPVENVPSSVGEAPADAGFLSNRQWIHLGWILIAIQLVAKWIYLSGGKIELSQDETYQWLWSKHLALSYYSKPPLIAYVQFLGTHLWGDTAFGVRFFAPIISTIVRLTLLHFLARTVNARAGFWVTALASIMPLMAVGNTLMTIDPLSVMFWMLAIFAGWRAIQENAKTRDWLLVGLWIGLGFLSKYTALFQLLCWVVVFACNKTARIQLRKPGPYLALLVLLASSLPVLIWNSQHHWITVHHVATDGALDQAWELSAANVWHGFKRFTVEFVMLETLLLNPFFVPPIVWAVFAFWRRSENRPLLRFLFFMSAPEFIIYFLLTFHSRVLPNWIAPCVLPMLCIGVIYWEEQWRNGRRAIRYWLLPGMIIGIIAVLVMQDSNLVAKATGYQLPPKLNPTRRVTAWRETAQAVEEARNKLLAEGKPVFVIGDHYGITSELAFYMPEAKARLSSDPLVYYQTSTEPLNQFYFWPGYKDRKGENAIFVRELGLSDSRTVPPGKSLLSEFDSVTDLGSVMVMYRGLPVRQLQVMECRGLR